jgi:septum formation protein
VAADFRGLARIGDGKFGGIRRERTSDFFLSAFSAVHPSRRYWNEPPRKANNPKNSVPTPPAIPTPPLLLASRSPRRRLLLEQWGYPHEAEQPGFEDGVLQSRSGGPSTTWKEIAPDQWVVSLAYLKAWAGAKLASAKGRIVLGADTTCVVDGAMAGTPTSESEARDMLKSMVGKQHQVLTGVALIDLREASGDPDRSRRMFVDRASVRWGDISDEQIDEYVASGAWQGKAGGYNLAERLAAGWPIQYEGDETTIMGLPMRKLRVVLGGMVE